MSSEKNPTNEKSDKPPREVMAMMQLIKGRTDAEIAEIATGLAPNAVPALRLISGDITKSVAIALAAIRHSRA